MGVILIACPLLAAAQVPQSVMGRWKQNVAKSTERTGTAPKSSTVRWEAAPNGGAKVTVDTVDAAGSWSRSDTRRRQRPGANNRSHVRNIHCARTGPSVRASVAHQDGTPVVRQPSGYVENAVALPRLDQRLSRLQIGARGIAPARGFIHAAEKGFLRPANVLGVGLTGSLVKFGGQKPDPVTIVCETVPD